MGEQLQFDPNFNGPLKKRSCTDVIFCLLFIVFCVIWALIAAAAFLYGDPNRLLHPTDSTRHMCGINEIGKYDNSDKPFLIYFDLTKCASYATVLDGCPTPSVCVTRCPDYYWSIFYLKSEEMRQYAGYKSFQAARDKMICNDDVKLSEIIDYDIAMKYVREEKCAAYIVATQPVIGRCIPAIIMNITNIVLSKEIDKMAENSNGLAPNSTVLASTKSFVNLMLQARTYGERIVQDLNKVWPQIVGLLAFSAVVAFIWILAMRWVAGIMIWLSILLSLVLLTAITAFSWYRYYILKSTGTGTTTRITLNYQLYYNMTSLIFTIAIILSVLLIFLLALLIFLYSRIQIAIAMIVESSKAVVHIMSALVFPVLPFVLEMVVFAYWATVATYLYTWGRDNCRILGLSKSELNDDVVLENGTWCDCATVNTTKYCKFVNFTTDEDLVFYAQLYNLFGLFWALFFVDALCKLTLAGTFASYYWAYQKPKDVPAFPVAKAFYRALRYHVGSMAFGALILAFVRIIRIIFEYIESKLKKSENVIAEFLLKCFKCCLWCLEKFLRFLSKNAYIMMAIHGKNFCVSAKDAFSLLTRNVVRVVVLNGITEFLLCIGKLAIASSIGVLSYFYFSGTWKEASELLPIELNYFYVPIIIVILGVWSICTVFFGVYEMAVDTTFLCFLEDSERNDGSSQKPYFMSKRLKEICNK